MRRAPSGMAVFPAAGLNLSEVMDCDLETDLFRAPKLPRGGLTGATA